MKNYCLPDSYISRTDNVFFDDTIYKDEYQDDVYFASKRVYYNNNYTTVIDIGCGSGFKLIKYFSEASIIGVDLEPTLTYLRERYSDRIWCDLQSIDNTIDYDLIICSDVIEHIINPTEFINELNKIKFKKIVFSTPDKLQMYGYDHLGPPNNTAHVREWNMRELNNYLSELYNIEEHFKSSPNSNTQIAVCTKK